MERIRFITLLSLLLSTLAAAPHADAGSDAHLAQQFPIAPGSHPHDVAPDPAGGAVYFTAQRSGRLGILDPATGRSEQIPLGEGAAPHGVIIGPDRGVWITDGGSNAILRVDPHTRQVKRWPLPPEASDANLNTATFDRSGRIWFTGQSGFYGRLDPATGDLRVWKAPRGRGPYGICTTPDGQIYFASLAHSYIAHVDPRSGEASVIEPPTPRQGARRIWADARGRLWVSYWNTGQVGAYDPATGRWREWKLPGQAHAYAIWVDPADRVWLSDWSTNALVRFDPVSEQFTAFPLDAAAGAVRQIMGRKGEVWAAESALDRLVRVSNP